VVRLAAAQHDEERKTQAGRDEAIHQYPRIARGEWKMVGV
jgi:hypothetical protein